jgi:hypothetical protein
MRILVILLGLGLLAGCTKTYHVQTDPSVPEVVAAAVKGKTFHEGRNELLDFTTHKLFGEVKGGKLVAVTLEVDGKKPRTINYLARDQVAQPAPPWPGGETPPGCDQRLDLCKAGCSGDRCCLLECWFNFELCQTGQSPLPLGQGGIRIM